MKYTKEYFIKKFEAIPDKEIGMGELLQHCALWHCGVRLENGGYTSTEESTALIKLFGGNHPEEFNRVYGINDSKDYSLGKTPKERILNKLKSL